MALWRFHGIGPAYVKSGENRVARVHYRLSDLEAYVARRRTVPPRDPRPKNGVNSVAVERVLRLSDAYAGTEGIDPLLEDLRAACREAGSVAAFARAHKLHVDTLNKAMANARPVPPKVAELLGYTREVIVRYRRKSTKP